MQTRFSIRRGVQFGVLSALLALGVGCKQAGKGAQESGAQANDQQILSQVQAKLNGEQALNGQDIQASVDHGVVTLTGAAANDASRALAAADSGSIEGVKTVINNLTVAPPTVSKAAPEAHPKPEAKKAKPQRARFQKAAPEPAPQTAQAAPPPPPAATPPPEPVQTVAPPPPPPPPVVKTITLDPGTVIPVRMIDSLDSATTQTDSLFHGSLATDLIVDGMVAAPRGASVIGRVVTAKDAGHFSGSSQLTLELTKLYAGNQEISLVTDQYTKEGTGRGKNTAVKTGAGAVLGGLIGALAGGGKGAAIGAAAGGGVGAGTNGITRGQQVQIPSETILNFRLQSAVSVKTSKVAKGSPSYSEDAGPQLKRYPGSDQ